MSDLQKNIELSVVVLCYHSENIIEKFVEQLVNEITELNISFELVLVANYDKNSDDNTPVLAKQIAEKFPNIETEVMLQWATINGAKALQMDDTLGTFEKGKKPGVVLIEKLNDNKFNKESVSRRIL